MNKEQILYEDKDIIVCHKPAGIATQTARIGQFDMVSEVSNYLGAPIKLVHRLDQPVEGILVFARNQKAAGELSRQITSDQMEKYYYAVVVQNQEKNKAPDTTNDITLINYLYKDNKSNSSSVVAKDKNGAKRAELCYRILNWLPVVEFCKEYNNRSVSTNFNDKDNFKSIINFGEMNIALTRIKLLTGRHHQIRVQMSNAGMSLLGDYKYADEKTRELSDMLAQKNIALCAYELIFDHPATGKRMTFHKDPTGQIFQNFL